jgi:hypothetical protein
MGALIRCRQAGQANRRLRSISNGWIFSDVVFAIAIALPVIDVRVPHLPQASDAALDRALLDLLPQRAARRYSLILRRESKTIGMVQKKLADSPRGSFRLHPSR